MKKIKVKAKEKELPDLKGFNLCDTIFKDKVEEIENGGEQKALVSIQSITGKYISVRVLNYKKRDYFTVKQEGEVFVCMQM